MLPLRPSPSIYQECKCLNQVLYEQTYLCNYCHESFCLLCVRTEVVDVYCRGCNTAKSKMAGSSIFCPKCFECPECNHLLSVVMFRDQQVLKCQFCHWNSIEIKVSGKTSDQLFALVLERINNSTLQKKNFFKAKASLQLQIQASKAQRRLLPRSQILKQKESKFLMTDLVLQQEKEKQRLQKLDIVQGFSLLQFKQEQTQLQLELQNLPKQVRFNTKKSKACVKCGAYLFSTGKQKSQKYFSGQETLRLYPELRLRRDRKAPGLFDVGVALFNYSVRACQIEVKQISSNVQQVNPRGLRLQEYMVKKQGETLRFSVMEESGVREVSFWFRLKVKSSEEQRVTNKIIVRMGGF